MEPLTKGPMGIFTTIIVVVVVMVAASGQGSLPVFQYRRTASSASYSSGIQLNLALNSTSLLTGQKLNVAVSIVNTLHNTNVVKTSNNSQFQGVPIALWPACFFGPPAAVVVLQGYYGLRELQAIANAPFDYYCMEGWSVDHVIFQPMSDQVNLTGVGGLSNVSNQTLGPFHLKLNFTTGGYWNLRSLAGELNIPIIGERSADSIPFVPGVYTVAVADEWGQSVVAHFTVSANEPSEGSLIYLSNDCYATGAGGYIPCFGSSRPYVFNCAAAAAASQGCTQEVTSTLAPYPSYIINIRYPFISSSALSWANCRWIVSGATGALSGSGHCFSSNSTSFVVGGQAPPSP
jgi:hypothetical protein